MTQKRVREHRKYNYNKAYKKYQQTTCDIITVFIIYGSVTDTVDG